MTAPVHTPTMGAIAITGAQGFLGWHLRCHLKGEPEGGARAVPREAFEDPARLAAALEGASVVFHLAGQNRGPEDEVEATNLRLADQLLAALDRLPQAPAVVFANSIHHTRDTAFGRSKREAARRLSAWLERRGARFVDAVLPHLFGEGGRPHYNSAIATFCHQLARGEAPVIQEDGVVELLHAQRASAGLLALARDPQARGTVRVHGTPMRVSDALVRLQALQATYAAGILPRFDSDLDLDLFNAYRSCLYPDRYPTPLTLHTDARGSLFEAVKSRHGGQAFLSTTKPGITRGRHYHRHKLERFLVVSGQAEIRIRRLFGEEVRVFPVSGAAPCVVDIPTLHTHEITNTGTGDLLTLFWSHEIFDPARPDTYPEPVIVEP